MAHPEVDLAGSVRTYSDAELMENRRRFILSIRAHKMRSFVRKERLIPRRKGTKLKSDKTEQAPFTRCSSLMTPVMYSLIINYIGVEDDDEDTYWRRISRGQVMNERADPAKLIYINICKRLKITPSAKVADGLSDPTLRISNTSLGSSGIEACAVALVNNKSITTLKLGWNGFSKDGSMAMARALLKNSTLRHLDLTNNRISLDCLIYLVKGIKVNSTLRILKLGLNPLTSDGATYIMDAILRNISVTLEELDMEGQTVNHMFLAKLDRMREKRPFIVHHGIVIQQDDIATDTECFLDENPMSILVEYIKQNNLRLVDLFKKLDTDNNFYLTRDDLRNGFLVSVLNEESGLHRLKLHPEGSASRKH
ncbi:hypothetical protein LSH36_125g07038 [Paralvinella palmiformis]|uniref:EF-hand domain-containing protein n=1 Tax=Paralvinella palmiformis TaxID=53620 RepID=A0AAD9N8D7_9ANNE|nr:hypothetical protein LSH36_125g07038 [Paralvinella palmiformis]